MAEDKSFKQLIEEQKKTNKLLMQQIASDAKGSDLGTSFKNSAGEIINDVLIGNKQKRESDETQAVIKKSSEKRIELDEEHNKKNAKVWNKISSTLTGAFVGKKGGAGKTAADKESFKDERDKDNAMFGKYLGKNSFVGKNLLGVFNGIGDVAKSLYGKGKGILSVLLGVAGYGLLLKYLNSEGFKEFISSGDAAKKIAKAAKAIFGKGGLIDRIMNFFVGDPNKPGTEEEGIFNMVGRRLGKLYRDLNKAHEDPNDDYGYDDAAKDNATTIAGIVGVLYFKTLLRQGALLGGYLLKNVGLYTAVRVYGKSVITRLLGLGATAFAGFGTLVAVPLVAAAGIIGVVKSIYDTVAWTFSDEAKNIRNDGKASWTNIIGSFFQNLYNNASKGIGVMLGMAGFEELEKEFKSPKDYRADLKKLYTDFGTFLVDRFINRPMNFIKRFFRGDTEEDLKGDVDNLKKKRMYIQEYGVTRFLNKKGYIQEYDADFDDMDGVGGTITKKEQLDKIDKKIKEKNLEMVRFGKVIDQKKIVNEKNLSAEQMMKGTTVIQDNKKVITTHHNGGGMPGSQINIGFNDFGLKAVSGTNLFMIPGMN